jgi:hypothetical protein
MESLPDVRDSDPECPFAPRRGKVVRVREFLEKLKTIRAEKLTPGELVSLRETEGLSAPALLARLDGVKDELLAHSFYDAEDRKQRGTYIDGAHLMLLQKITLAVTVNPADTKRNCVLEREAFDQCTDHSGLLAGGRIRSELPRARLRVV